MTNPSNGNANAPRDDRWARESFTFRRMTPTQIWAFSIGLVVLVVVVAALMWS